MNWNPDDYKEEQCAGCNRTIIVPKGYKARVTNRGEWKNPVYCGECQEKRVKS